MTGGGEGMMEMRFFLVFRENVLYTTVLYVALVSTQI